MALSPCASSEFLKEEEELAESDCIASGFLGKADSELFD
jgi:hypothetical protein